MVRTVVEWIVLAVVGLILDRFVSTKVALVTGVIGAAYLLVTHPKIQPKMALWHITVIGCLLGALVGGLAIRFVWLRMTSPRARISSQPPTPNASLPVQEPTPFRVVCETSLFGSNSNTGGIFWTVHNTRKGLSKSPLSSVIAVRIVNMQSVAAMISQLTIEANTRDGEWVKVARIDSSSVELFGVGSDMTKAVRMRPVMLDQMLEGRAMSPRETVKGWLLLAYPRTQEIKEFNGNYRFTIADTAGVRYVQEDAATDRGDFSSNSMPAAGTADISALPVVLYQDLPGYWGTLKP